MADEFAACEDDTRHNDMNIITAKKIRDNGQFAINQIEGGHRSEDAIQDLLAYAKQLEAANSRHVLNHIENICDKCGHTKTEDGCAFCIMEQRRRLPKMVCLCGSIRFADEFKRQELECLMRGEIALLPCCMWTDIQRNHGEGSDYKQRADARHKQLIDLADEVLVLNEKVSDPRRA